MTEIKRNDTVMIKRGIWKGHLATVTEVAGSGLRMTGGPTRVGVKVSAAPRPFSLAAGSVTLVQE